MFILLLILLWLGLHLVLRSKPIREPFIISHRGAAGLAPENTMAAISAALQHGASFIEVDVHRTADNVLVVMHDTSVRRTTNFSGEIRNLTWDTIKSLDAGSHFSAEYTDEPVPRLETVLDQIRQSSATLIIEVKNPELYPGIETEIAELIRKFEGTGRVMVISFDWDWLEQFHQTAPEIAIGSLAVWMLPQPLPPGTQMVDVHWSTVLLDPSQIYRLHRRGYTVGVWTVNNTRLMKLLWGLGVDGITTDYPNRL